MNKPESQCPQNPSIYQYEHSKTLCIYHLYLHQRLANWFRKHKDTKQELSLQMCDLRACKPIALVNLKMPLFCPIWIGDYHFLYLPISGLRVLVFIDRVHGKRSGTSIQDTNHSMSDTCHRLKCLCSLLDLYRPDGVMLRKPPSKGPRHHQL